MNPTPNMKLLLAAILADVERLEAMPEHSRPGLDRDEWRERYLERQEYRQCGVRHNLERWLGHPPTRSDSAVFSRTLRQMEDAGLIVRVNRWGAGSRTTHVRLTSLGRVMAERLESLSPSLPDDGVKTEPLDIDDVDFAGALEGLDDPAVSLDGASEASDVSAG